MTLTEIADRFERSPAHNLNGTTVPSDRVDSVFALDLQPREEEKCRPT
jgi:hypothetical protein